MSANRADWYRVVAASSEIREDDVVPFYIEDGKLRVSIARIAGRLYAFDDLCPCADEACPLSGGLLTGTSIMCQCHGSRFDLASGAVMNGPATEALHVYEVRETEGGVEVRTPGADR